MTDIRTPALALAREAVPGAILNHSLRTYGFAVDIAAAGSVTDFDDDELYVACILHDVGASGTFDGPERFEVEGADAAFRLLAELGSAPDVRGRVWEAIALHTSPGIAERAGPLTRLVRLGVLLDFSGHPPEVDGLPRLNAERVLSDAVTKQALRQPSKAPASSWPADLVRGYDPDSSGVNVNF
jgi:hypothetical protein